MGEGRPISINSAYTVSAQVHILVSRIKPTTLSRNITTVCTQYSYENGAYISRRSDIRVPGTFHSVIHLPDGKKEKRDSNTRKTNILSLPRFHGIACVYNASCVFDMNEDAPRAKVGLTLPAASCHLATVVYDVLRIYYMSSVQQQRPLQQ